MAEKQKSEYFGVIAISDLTNHGIVEGCVALTVLLVDRGAVLKKMLDNVRLRGKKNMQQIER